MITAHVHRSKLRTDRIEEKRGKGKYRALVNVNEFYVDQNTWF